MAALAKGPVVLKNPLHSDDTEAMIDCLRTLGVDIQTPPNQIIVHGTVSPSQTRATSCPHGILALRFGFCWLYCVLCQA